MIDGWAAILMVLPFGVYALRRAKVADSPLYIVEREAGLNLGRVESDGVDRSSGALADESAAEDGSRIEFDFDSHFAGSVIATFL